MGHDVALGRDADSTKQVVLWMAVELSLSKWETWFQRRVRAGGQAS